MAHQHEQIESSAIERVLARFDHVRKASRGWTACCPAHQDRHPSLSIGLGKEDRILLKCHAGCSIESIVQAAGLTMQDLFATALRVQRVPLATGITLLDIAQDKRLPWQFLVNLDVTDMPKGGVRIDYYLPDGTRASRTRIRTSLIAKEGSRWSAGPGEIVPYGLEDLATARNFGYLILVEGESDRWTLVFHRFPVLALPGAEMTKILKLDYLQGIERLYLFQEPDTAGAKFVHELITQLQHWNWSGTAWIVSLPDAKDPNELHQRDPRGFKAAFQEALDHAIDGFPSSSSITSPLARPSTERMAEQISASTSEPAGLITLQSLLEQPSTSTQWTIDGLLPEGVSLLAGKPKQGKSWLALELALTIAAGEQALDIYQTRQGEVLYLALEDTAQRLHVRVRHLLHTKPWHPTGITFATQWPRLDQDGLSTLEHYLNAHSQIRLVVIDTWAKVAPQGTGKTGSQYAGDYTILTNLKHLAERTHCSIFIIHHLRKSSALDALDEITGSMGIVGAVDTILLLKRERGQHDATLLLTGRDIEEQELPLRFDPTTAWWHRLPPEETTN